mgnify:FL=1
MKAKPKTFTFTQTIKLDHATIRSTLESVRDQLLRHGINGSSKKLTMESVCDIRFRCGTAACIGGWVSIFLLGFEGSIDKDVGERQIVKELFSKLCEDDNRLYRLFYADRHTGKYNTPNVAATAIQRYLDGKSPWPKGEMPDVLRYKRAASRIAR